MNQNTGVWNDERVMFPRAPVRVPARVPESDPGLAKTARLAKAVKAKAKDALGLQHGGGFPVQLLINKGPPQRPIPAIAFSESAASAGEVLH